jgi:hypothetical protein
VLEQQCSQSEAIEAANKSLNFIHSESINEIDTVLEFLEQLSNQTKPSMPVNKV